MEASEHLDGPVALFCPSLRCDVWIELKQLLGFDVLRHCHRLIEPGLHASFAKNRRVRDRHQHRIIMRTGKVQQPRPLVLALVLGRRNDPVHRTLQPSARQVRQRVGQVDGDGTGLRGDVAPLAVGVAEDLQSCDGLAEQERHGAQVGVAAAFAVVAGLPLLLAAWVVQHVAHVVLGFLVVRVLSGQVVLVRQAQDDGEQAQQRQHDVGVQRAVEVLDLGKVRLQQRRLVVLAREVGRELGEVVDLHVVLGVALQVSARSAPAVVVRGRVVDLVLLLLRHGQVEEILGQRELLVYLCLREAEVLHIEEADVVHGVLELLGQSLLATRSRVVFQVERDELGPGKVGLGLRWVLVGRKPAVVVLVGVISLVWLDLDGCRFHGGAGHI